MDDSYILRAGHPENNHEAVVLKAVDFLVAAPAGPVAAKGP